MRPLVVCFMGICLLLFNKTVAGQHPVLKQFTVENGMPGSMVYYSMQDSKGYIWSGTDRGVTRFDGHQFDHFTIKDGLPSNEVWRISEDRKGRLWLSTFAGVCYIDNGIIKTFTSDKLPLRPESINHYTNSASHLIIVQTGAVNCYAMDDMDSLHHFDQYKPDYFNVMDGAIIIENENTKTIFDQHQADQVGSRTDSLLAFNDVFIRDKGNSIASLLYTSSIQSSLKDFATFSQNKVALVAHNQIWQIDDSGIQPINLNRFWKKDEDRSIQRIEGFAPNKIWFRTKDYNYVVDTTWQLYENFDFLKEMPINHILSDEQKNLWLSTRYGLFFLNNNALFSKTYSPPQRKNPESISFLAKSNSGEVWGIGQAGNLYQLKDGQLQLRTNRPLVLNPTDLEFGPKGNLWLGGDQLIRIAKYSLTRENVTGEVWDTPVAVKKIIFDATKNPIIADYRKLYKIDAVHPEKLKYLFKGRIYGMVERDDGNLWIAGKQGLRIISKEGEELNSTTIKKEALYKLPINNIVPGKDQSLWIAVNSKGVYCHTDERLDSIAQLQGLLVQSLSVDNKDRLWVSTNVGLARVADIKLDPFQYTFKWFTEKDGLASNDVKESIVVGDQIFAATEKGLTILEDTEEQRSEENDHFYFSALQINDRDTSILPLYDLNHQENDLTISYICLDYQNMDRIVFQYQMEGIDEGWVDTRSYSKRYQFLPIGKYKFRLRRKPIENSAHTPEISIIFNINPPWWKTKIAIAAIIIGGISLVYLLTRYRINRIKKRAEVENIFNKKLAQLELKALQAQMNPHFVFNALNAIQDFIFKKDSRVANRYLVKFSRLMRLFLESSKERFITLQDEISMLEFYIQLEHLRFKNKFTYEIIVDDNLEPSVIEIPSMLLQPFVENAINHGLLYHKGVGRLTVSFLNEQNSLRCCIEDNGIGRKKATLLKEQSLKSYKSRGTQLVEERLKAWNVVGEASVDISIEDLYDDDNVGCGTRVEIIIGG